MGHLTKISSRNRDVRATARGPEAVAPERVNGQILGRLQDRYIRCDLGKNRRCRTRLSRRGGLTSLREERLVIYLSESKKILPYIA
jgi:hypothetical protein